MFTKISANNPLFQILSQIYSYIINRINWWMDNTDTVYIVIRVWLRTKRYQRIYASNMHDFVQTIFVWNFIWTASCATPKFHPKKHQPVSASQDSCFVSHEIDIYSKPSTKQSVHSTVRKLDFFCRGVL